MGGSCCGSYIVYHYCLRFDRGVVHVVFVILYTITVSDLTEEWWCWLYCLPILLRFDRGVGPIVTVYCLP